MVNRDWLRFLAMWAILTVIAFIAVFSFSILPAGYARESEIVDEAFLLLMALAVPVFTLVVAMIAYSLIRFRVSGDPIEDGPPIRNNRRVVIWWLVVTTALTAVVLVNPGFVGLAAIRGDSSADLVVQVEAKRFKWTATYPGGRMTDDELVLPVDSRIRFDITSPDVLHSFWIPAFRVKLDAVPGRTSQLYVTTEETASFEDDPNLRVQCAELCGAGHSGMSMPVRIVEIDEYEGWLGSPPPEPPPQEKG